MGSKKKAGHKQRNSHKVHFRKWHRRLGFLAAIFLLNLAITGILLNHYQDFSFHKDYVSSPLILNLYGVTAPDSADCYSVHDMQLCAIGEQLYLNGRYWKDADSNILLLAELLGDRVLVTQNKVYWLTADGQLIDSLAISDTIATAIGAAIYEQTLYLDTADGQYQLNNDSFSWQPLDSLVPISDPVKDSVNPVQLANLQQQYRARQITELKFLQDLHSGAIIGLAGPWVTDISGLILIWLVISGFVTWQRRRKKSA